MTSPLGDKLLALSGCTTLLLWEMAETSGTVADDRSTNANDGTINGGPTLGVAGGSFDGETAITWGGTDDYATFPDHASYDYAGSSPYWAVIAFKIASTGSTYWIAEREEFGQNIRFNGANLSHRMTNESFVETAAAVDDGAWHLAVLRVSAAGAGNAQWVLDGTANGSAVSTTGNTAITSAAAWNVARRPNGTSYLIGSTQFFAWGTGTLGDTDLAAIFDIWDNGGATGVTVTPSTASLTLDTFAPTVTTTANQTVTPSTASLTTATFAPTVTATANQTVTPSTAALALETFAPTVSTTAHVTATPDTASLTLATFAPIVTATGNQTVTPDTANITLTTFEPTVTTSGNQVVTPGVASLSMTAFAPSVVISDHKVVTPDPASLSLTAFAPTVVASGHRTVTPSAASLVLTTFAPTVTAGTPFDWAHATSTVTLSALSAATVTVSEPDEATVSISSPGSGVVTI